MIFKLVHMSESSQTRSWFVTTEDLENPDSCSDLVIIDQKELHHNGGIYDITSIGKLRVSKNCYVAMTGTDVR